MYILLFSLALWPYYITGQLTVSKRFMRPISLDQFDQPKGGAGKIRGTRDTDCVKENCGKHFTYSFVDFVVVGFDFYGGVWNFIRPAQGGRREFLRPAA